MKSIIFLSLTLALIKAQRNYISPIWRVVTALKVWMIKTP